MNNTYGSIRPAMVDIQNDVEIFYHYRPSRSSEDTSFKAFQKVDTPTLWLQKSTFDTDDYDDTLPGIFNLSLPASVFSKVGIYTIYIRPKEIDATITDIGVLAAYSDINGIVIDTDDLDCDDTLFGNDMLNGYRIEYYSNDGSGLIRQEYYRIITGANRCEPITQNLASSDSNSNAYRFNSSSNLCFLTVTPNSSPSYKANSKPYIGAPGQSIKIINTKFDPIMIEVEMVKHDTESVYISINGDQIRSLDNGLITTYNEDGEIFSQTEHFTVKDSYTGNTAYEVKKNRTDNVETSPNYNDIMS